MGNLLLMLQPGERRRGDLSRTPSDADTAGGPRTVWYSLTIENGEERGHDWTMLARILASTHTNNTRYTRALGISQRRRLGFPREMCYLRKRRRKCWQAAGRRARCSVQQQRQRQHRRKDAVQLGLRDGCRWPQRRLRRATVGWERENTDGNSGHARVYARMCDFPWTR